MERNCDYCGKLYNADPRNLKRGWGLTCNKSCAALLRERNKPSYNIKKVAKNNLKRNGISKPSKFQMNDEELRVKLKNIRGL